MSQRSQYERKGLPADERSWAERIASPTNIADMAEALKIPDSPPSKRARELEAQQEKEAAIIQILIMEFIVLARKATEQERNALYQWMIQEHAEKSDKLREASELQVRQQLLAQQQQREAESRYLPILLQIQEVETRLNTYPEKIQKLKDSIETNKKELVTVEKKETENDRQYRVINEAQKKQYKEDLAEKNLKFKVAIPGQKGKFKEVDPNSAEGEEIIAKAYKSENPSKVIAMLRDSIMKSYKIESDQRLRTLSRDMGAEKQLADRFEGAIPAAPPPPPLPNAKSMAAKDNMNKQIRLLAALSGGQTGEDLLNVLKNNKEVVEQLTASNNSPKVIEQVTKSTAMHDEIRSLSRGKEDLTGPELLRQLKADKESQKQPKQSVASVEGEAPNYDPKAMAQKSAVTSQIKMSGKLSGEQTGKHVLEATNQEAVKSMPQASTAMEACFANALTINEEKTNIKEEIKRDETQLQVEEAAFESDKVAYKGLTGVEFKPNEQQQTAPSLGQSTTE